MREGNVRPFPALQHCIQCSSTFTKAPMLCRSSSDYSKQAGQKEARLPRATKSCCFTSCNSKPATLPLVLLHVSVFKWLSTKKPRYFHLTPSRNKLAKYVDPKYREIILTHVGLLLHKELQLLSSKKTKSVL